MSPPALSVRTLTKTFGGTRALKGVSFDVRPGEVHGLLGHNGSGKSTLIKVLAGFHDPDPGSTVGVYGRALSFPMLAGAFRRYGLSFVHQNLGLVPSLTVLENLRVANLTGGGSLYIDWAAERRAARQSLERFGLDIDPAQRLAELSLGDRALIAIVRAFEDIAASQAEHATPGVLVLDEPTPFLPRASVERLFALVRAVVKQGASVVFVSHDIGEVLEITDRATVLRDGSVAGSIDTTRASRAEIIEMIVGHAMAPTGPRNSNGKTFVSAATVQDLGAPRLGPVTFSVGRGEILGLAGLIGSGFERIPSLLFGAARAEHGVLEIAGKTILLAAQTPRQAMAQGVALLPADRAVASGTGSLTVADNMLLPALRRHFHRGRLDRRGMTTSAQALSTRYEVRPNNPDLKLSALSGGNAQKVLLAKWMNLSPALLLLEEPTQGVDVGSREQVYAALRAAAATGTAVVVASSDHEQLAEICDRVLVFAGGTITAELTSDNLTKEQIAVHCYHGESGAAVSGHTGKQL